MNMFDAYYYGVENGEVQGPLPLDAIGANVKRGAIPEWVMLSRNASGPWAPLELVKKLGDEAFTQPAKPKPESKSQPAKSQPVVNPAKAAQAVSKPPATASIGKQHAPTVAGFYEILSLIMSSLGAINLGLFVYYAVCGDRLWVTCATGAVTCFLLALGLQAAAELLKRLLEISKSVREIAEQRN